jgi:sortase (surface protein transpeptidase)
MPGRGPAPGDTVPDHAPGRGAAMPHPGTAPGDTVPDHAPGGARAVLGRDRRRLAAGRLTALLDAVPGRRRLAVDGLTALLAVAGLILLIIGASPAPPPAPPQRPVVAADPASGTVAAPAGRAAAPVGSAAAPAGAGTPSPIASSAAPGPVVSRGLPPSAPARLQIPVIGVDTALMSLGLMPDGTVEVPPLRAGAPAGWYRNGKTPGEVGPAVILGHVDTARDGPAVFYRLRELRPGDTATVRRADGSTAVFVVERVVEVPKTDFPTEDVYGPVDHPALRLVTCGGTFDHARREYRGNILVYARLKTSD